MRLSTIQHCYLAPSVSKIPRATAFRGVLGADDSAGKLSGEYTGGNVDYYEEFDASLKNITSDYTARKEEINKRHWFTGRHLMRLDDVYKGQLDAWQRGKEAFEKAKEQHLKDIALLLEQANKYNKSLEEINQLKGDYEATQTVIELAKKQQVNNTNTGFSKLGGYESEKATLQNRFINKIFEERAGVPVDIPNAILFFGPTGTGKTTFAIALAQEVQGGEEAVVIDMTNEPDEIMEEIEVETRRARKKFKQTKERTLILLDEVEGIAHQDSEVLDELKAKITKASKEDHCTYIMTSNNPHLISRDILTPDRVKFFVDVDPPDRENAGMVFEYYFRNLNISDINYDKMVNELLRPKEEGGVFSNSGIEYIYKTACAEDVKSTDGIIDIIKKAKPNITNGDLCKYEKSKKSLVEGGNGAK